MSSEAQRRATAKYIKDNLQELRFRVKTEQAEQIKAHAESKGMSLRAYLLTLIERDMAEHASTAPDEDSRDPS